MTATGPVDGPSPALARVLALVGGQPPAPAPAAPAATAPPAEAPALLVPGGRRGPLSGATWAGFAVGDLLGAGGMGEVYRALQVDLGRMVALKVMGGSGAGDPERRRRFAIEARAAARVQSPHVVQVHGAGEHEGRAWLALELVAGRSLAERLAEWRAGGAAPDPLPAARLALQAARGLAAVHAAGLVHRDIKPANLLVDGEGRLRVADFGLARILDDLGLTETGTVLGTPLYLAPEQAGGRPADARADVYALGCVLYELLTLRPPFSGDSPEELVRQHHFAEPELPAALNPAVPGDLQLVVVKCLQKLPARRYADAGELAGDLDRVLIGLAPLSAVFAPGQLSTGAAEALRRLAGWRRRLLGAAAVVAATALALAGGWWWWDARKAEERAVRARLAPLAAATTPPATAEADLERLRELAGAADPQVRQGRERLARIAAAGADLAGLAGRLDQPAARAEAAALLADLRAATGADDPLLQAHAGRLAAAEARVAALRARLAGLDRADPPSAALRRASREDLDRLALAAGDGDADVRRWRERCAAAAAEEEALRRRCARLDDPAPLTAPALDDLAQTHRRLAEVLAPGDDLPASWPARLADGRARLEELRRRLAADLAAPDDDDRATGRAEAAGAELAALLTLDPADRRRIDQRSQARAARAAERDRLLQSLRERCAVLDAPNPLPPGIDDDLAAYERLAGRDDARAVAWRNRVAQVRLLRRRLEPLTRAAAPPAGAEADLAALAALVGPGDPDLAAMQDRLARIAALHAELAELLDRPRPVPAQAPERLAAYAALTGGEDADARRWRARCADWAAAAGQLDLLDGCWALDPAGLERARAALAAAAAIAGAGDARVQAWTRRLAGLDPPAPAWAAAHGRDRHGPWCELEVGGVRARLRWLPAIGGRVGSPADEAGREADEGDAPVRLTTGRWIAATECTQELYRAVTGRRPSRREGGGHPVEQVSRADAEAFCRRLGELLPGCRARLPGEAEWELAVRAGASGPWAGLAVEGLVHAGSAGGHQEAGSGPLNAIGLAHGLGNVWEWCRDGYAPPPAGALAVDPPVAAGELGVARGGSYADPPSACRAANRVALDPGTRSPCLGFRFAVEE